MDPSSSYGLWWFNRKRTVRRQVAEEGPEGRIYRNKHKTNKRPPSDWIGVPVPDSGIPREVVDAARAAIKNNRPSSNSKRRSWELSGGLLWCRGCARRMSSTSITPGKGRTKRYFSYRCPSQGEGKACSGPKTVPAEKLEVDVWRLVSGLLKDPKTLRRDLDAVIESERVARCEDPEREAEAWIRKLAEVDDKRSRYQDMAAEGLITFGELGEKLVGLENARKTAEHALQALKSKRDRIADLEHDRDALLDSLMQIGAEALEALTPAERNRLYRILQLKVVLRKDRTLEVSGAFGEGLDVCELESQCRVASR